jgi:S1-C subfamily serine protease
VLARATLSLMFRALILVALLVVVPGAAPGQAVGVLHVKVTLTDAAGASMPVPGHALLISDNPATSAPRRVVTGPDGTVDVRLRPGNYTVESDEPVAFGGKGYQWTLTVDITAGRDVVLELTAANAEVGAAPAPSAAPRETIRGFFCLNGKTASSPSGRRSRASGIRRRCRGLVMTNQHAIGSASAVEVQLTPSIKVAARVLVADRVRDVADPLDRSCDHGVGAAGSGGLRGRAEAALRKRAEARRHRRAAPR